MGYVIRSAGEVLVFTAKALGAMSVLGAFAGVVLGGLRAGLAGIALPLLIIAISAGLCVFVAAVGSLLCRIGKKLTAQQAESLLLRDSRNPVLYLRSFADDHVAATPVAGGQRVDVIHPILAESFTGETEEEVLAIEMNRIGPCVAVGMPGERLPPIGAARMYFDHSKWEEGVRSLMARSELVVMRAATTPGFLLELKMAEGSLDPKKLLILLPFETKDVQAASTGAGGYAEFREAANRILPKELPPFSGKRVSGSSLSGVIHFDSDWTPKILNLEDVGETIKESFETISRRYSGYGRI